MEGLIQTKVVIKISKYYEISNVLICYSKYKEENENVFFIVTNKGTFFFHLLLLKTQSQLTLLHIYSWESVIIETKIFKYVTEIPVYM